MLKYFLILLLLPSWLCGAQKVFDLELPQKKFIKLNVFERAQYKKAYALVVKRNYKAAIDEFEKFKQQYPDNSQMAYVVFMKAYCLHQAKQRNKAVKVYNEVLDYFGDDILYAGASLYYMAQAHFDNGDIKSGLKAFKEMAEDEDYQKHALAAGAFRYLAENRLKNKKVSEAVKYLKLIVVNFVKENPREALIALNELCDYYILMKQISNYESFVKEHIKQEKEYHIVLTVTERMKNVLRFNDTSKWIRYTKFTTKEKGELLKRYLTYYRGKKAAFKDREWTYHSRLLDFLSQYGAAEAVLALKNAEVYIKTIKEEKKRDSYYSSFIETLVRYRLEGRFNLAVNLASKIKDPVLKQGRYSRIIDYMIRDGKSEAALVLLGRLSDKTLALWKKVSIYNSQKKYDNSITTMDQIAKDDPKQELAVKQRKAGLYHGRMKKYAEAIKLYREVGKPPSSLWSIADCYHKMGNIKMAVGTLTEVENAFPDNAPEAALRKTRIYHGAKNKKMTISTARRILKMYPKSSASSQAHQILEDYGISTGGGVIEEE